MSRCVHTFDWYCIYLFTFRSLTFIVLIFLNFLIFLDYVYILFSCVLSGITELLELETQAFHCTCDNICKSVYAAKNI